MTAQAISERLIEDQGEIMRDASIVTDMTRSEKPNRKFNADNLRKDLFQLMNELGQAILERKAIINGSILALLTGTHIFQYGPPGTAKSLLAVQLAEATQAKYYERLLHRNTKPNDLFGSPNIKKITEEGIEVLNTRGKLPEAEIAFLDEYFKCNPNLLNALLTILNERKFDNGEGTKTIPLWTAFMASNEIPTNEPILEALFDRTLQRYVTPYLQDDGSFDKMLAGNLGEVTTKISIDDLRAARQQIDQIELGPSARKSVLGVKQFLEKNKGIIRSDRRWRASMLLAKASAWLHGRDYVSQDDLLVLRNTLCHEMTAQEFAAIDEALKKLEDPMLAKVKNQAKMFMDEYRNYTNARSGQSHPILAKMDDIGKNMRRDMDSYKNSKDCDQQVLKQMQQLRDDCKIKMDEATAAEAARQS